MHQYDTDHILWAKDQAKAILERRFQDLDIERLADEVESLVRSERHSLRSAIQELMLHLLKWYYQPQKRTRSWITSIDKQREAVKEVLSENPSLVPTVEDVIADNYLRVVKWASVETNLPKKHFPSECPYSFDELMHTEPSLEGKK
jgi:hypothetical protein